MTDQPSQPPSDAPRDEAPAPVPSASEPPAGAPTTATAKPSAPPAFGTMQPGPAPYEAPQPSGVQALFPPEHPEYAVGAAFGGGLLLALILKRLAH